MEIDNEVILDLISRLQEQAARNQYGCPINFVYVASGAQHVDSIQHQHNYYGERENTGEDGRDPYETLLLQIIEPLKNERNWKALLLPYCAAVGEGVLPLWPHALFVQKTGIAVPSTPYSVWTKKDRFTHDELEPYAERFEQLKRQIDNSK